MRHILPVCVLLVLSATLAHGQQLVARRSATPSGATQPDASGERLKQLLRTAAELEQAGRLQEAATVQQQAHQERQRLLNYLDSLQAEVERIRQATGGRPQVVVHLKVLEMSLTKLRSFGYDLTKLQAKSAGSPDATKTDVAGGFSSVIDDGSGVALVIEALLKDHLAKVLAEPSLATLSGKKAVFNSGGKILLPQPRKDGTSPLEWQQYGTQVELTPEVVGDRVVRLSMHCQLSELDYGHTVRVGKEAYPGLRVREFATNTELRDGQTLVFSGLNQVRVEATNHGLPYVGDVPYVGAVFRNVKEERNEMAMLILVRTEIVRSAAK